MGKKNDNKYLTIRNLYRETYLFLTQFKPIPIPSKADSEEALRKMSAIYYVVHDTRG